jgi:hypothetical protein
MTMTQRLALGSKFHGISRSKRKAGDRLSVIAGFPVSIPELITIGLLAVIIYKIRS